MVKDLSTGLGDTAQWPSACLEYTKAQVRSPELHKPGAVVSTLERQR